jgi:formaldehyde-activating enzyme involved in methanogenesis
MKRLIILKSSYLDPKNKNKAEIYKEQVFICKKSVKEFVDAMKSLPSVKVIRYYDIVPQVVIEFPDKIMDEVYIKLRASDIVETIDTQLPKED